MYFPWKKATMGVYFNATRLVEERCGVVLSRLTCSEGRRITWVQMPGLTDLPLFRRRITWVQLNGKCMSRLDRMLVSHDWKAEWGIGHLWDLHRDVSDH